MALGTAGATKGKKTRSRVLDHAEIAGGKAPGAAKRQLGGGRRGSLAAAQVLKDAMKSAAWDKKGMPDTTVRKSGVPGYADAGVGTPSYIRAAANQAEGRLKNLGGAGKNIADGQINRMEHRVQGRWNAGNPPRG